MSKYLLGIKDGRKIAYRAIKGNALANDIEGIDNYCIEPPVVSEYVHRPLYRDGDGVSGKSIFGGEWGTSLDYRSATITEDALGWAEQGMPILVCEGKWIEKYNLIPGVTYYFGATTITPTGQLRMLHLPHIPNARDIGGWPTRDGHHIGYGRIYRGKALNRKGSVGDASDIDTLIALGVALDIDLRGSKGEGCDPSAKDMEDYHRIEHPAYYAMPAYESLLTDAAYMPRLRDILTRIVATLRSGKAVYIHCMDGADRTGTLCMLIEALCGATEESVLKDYELTSFSCQLNTLPFSANKPRAFFQHLHNNYGGRSQKNLSQQVRAWFEQFAKVDKSLLDDLSSLMLSSSAQPAPDATTPVPSVSPDGNPDVHPANPVPLTIRDLYKVNGTYLYTINGQQHPVERKKQRIHPDGAIKSNDAFNLTHNIPCQGYHHLRINMIVDSGYIGAFLDAHGNILDDGKQRGKFRGITIKQGSIHYDTKTSCGYDGYYQAKRELVFDIPPSAHYLVLNLSKDNNPKDYFTAWLE